MDEVFDSKILAKIQEAGVIAVLVIERVSDAVPVARSLLDGGVSIMELTLRTDAAVDALRAIREEVPDMMAGMGTILTPAQLIEVSQAGAAFGVSPGTTPRVIETAREINFSFAPGVATPSDIETALELECRVLKFFPAEPSGGIAYLKSMAGPYKHLGLKFMPLGGVNLENMASYIESELVPAVGGSFLAKSHRIKEKDWASITGKARDSKKIVRQIRREGIQ